MFTSGTSPSLICALATTGALLLAAPALAAPAGNEYLPKVPTATGEQQVGGPDDVVIPYGSGSGSSGSGAGSGKGADGGKLTREQREQLESLGSTESSGPTAEQASADADSSGLLDLLLNPAVLVLLAGVPIIAVGMTLIRRDGPSRAMRRTEGDAAPHTPDGEIVAAGGDDQS